MSQIIAQHIDLIINFFVLKLILSEFDCSFIIGFNYDRRFNDLTPRFQENVCSDDRVMRHFEHGEFGIESHILLPSCTGGTKWY